MSRLNKINIVFLLVAIASLIVAIAPAAAQDEVVLRWRTRPDNQAEIDVYQAVSDSIDAAWDGVTLQYEPGNNEGAGYQQTLLNEISAGTAPDVFWIPGASVATFASEGAILNLAELAAGMEGFDPAVFYPQQIAELTYNPETMTNGADSGALWGLPRDASAFALYVNLDLFEEAGIATPAELLADGNWNWDTFMETAVAISDLGDNVYGFGMNAWWANWWMWVNMAGGSYFNADKTACGLNSEGTTAAMSFLSELYSTSAGVPYGTDSEPPFIAGNVGMFLNGRWATPNTVAQAQFNWDYAEVPAGPSGQSNWLFWGAYVVNMNSSHAAEAFDLITRLTSVDVQAQVTALGANIPSRAGEDAVNAFLNAEITAGKNNAAFTNALANYAVAEAPLWTANFDSLDGAVETLVGQVLTDGTLAPEDFGAAACAAADPFFAEAAGG
ncbi:MAG: sugar ABC transporter substrate-binding protein [Anaerolineae bacterium]|nr:sugar ABC transporter substrate-binding protein [Anaerolineae bacterium]